ncbi:MAG: dihydroorotase [bacterium]|nr:dihydroorotase [bacterium]
MAMPINELTIISPDDWHLHVRQGDRLRAVIPISARRFGRINLMPNTIPPNTTAAMALAYKEQAGAAIPQGVNCVPLVTLYLTDNTSVEEIRKAWAAGIRAVKYYPAGATTNSDSGVTDIRKVYEVLAEMQRLGMLLLMHGEVNDPETDPFDREKEFLKRILKPLVKRFPKLRVVLEHVTTKDAVDFVKKHPHMAATITAHHLFYNRKDLFKKGIRPHFYCLPILKREDPHQYALIEAATSGNPQFFFGSDLAPHEKHTKEAACGCAGCWSPASIELVAEVFERTGTLHNLEKFVSINGARYYRLPRNKKKITLVLKSWVVPSEYPFGTVPPPKGSLKKAKPGKLVPFDAGETRRWQVQGIEYPELKAA